MSLLQVRDLSVSFSLSGVTFSAVRQISFDLEPGQSVAIVGESGCGKTATAQAIARLSPGKISGQILFEGAPITPDMLGKKIGMIFQDPMTSLNPTMKIGAQIMEAMLYHKLANKISAKAKTLQLLDLVGLKSEHFFAYPHTLSGGQRQRVCIAIALSCNPALIIADEPTTALDTPLQKQILHLLKKLQKQFLLITHDLNLVQDFCDKVLVMYAGKIVEQGSAQEILTNPRHPYTQMLLRCRPRPDTPKDEPIYTIAGAPPHLFKPIKGCAFKERCPHATSICNQEPTGNIACWKST